MGDLSDEDEDGAGGGGGGHGNGGGHGGHGGGHGAGGMGSGGKDAGGGGGGGGGHHGGSGGGGGLVGDAEAGVALLTRSSTRPLGKHKHLFGRPGARFPRSCVVGPDWPCLMVTFVLVWAPPVAVLTGFAAHLRFATVLAMCASLFLVTFALCGAAFSDPGILPKNERAVAGGPTPPPTDPVTGRTLCARCLVYRPRGAFHCRDCDACIEELDHHCPWTGHCIGKNNMFYFQSYLALLVVHIVTFVVVTVVLASLQAQATLNANGGNGG